MRMSGVLKKRISSDRRRLGSFFEVPTNFPSGDFTNTGFKSSRSTGSKYFLLAEQLAQRNNAMGQSTRGNSCDPVGACRITYMETSIAARLCCRENDSKLQTATSIHGIGELVPPTCRVGVTLCFVQDL